MSRTIYKLGKSEKVKKTCFQCEEFEMECIKDMEGNRLDFLDTNLEGQITFFVNYYDVPLRIGYKGENNSKNRSCSFHIEGEVENLGTCIRTVDYSEREFNDIEKALSLKGIKPFREKLCKEIAGELKKKMKKTFSGERDVELEFSKNLKEDVCSPKVASAYLLKTPLTKHKIVLGYHFEEMEFIYRLKKMDSNKIEKYDSKKESAGAIELLGSVKSYFRDAKSPY